jgi:hypothetical protein
MEINIELLISALVAVGGLAAALLTNQKYQKAKERLVEFIGDLADFLALVYAASKDNTLCDPTTLKTIAAKTEEIWTDIEALGPTFAALLAQKSSLAEILKTKEVG